VSSARTASILVLNAGSSSLKFALREAGKEEALVSGQIGGIGQTPYLLLDGLRLDSPIPADVGHGEAFELIFDWLMRQGHEPSRLSAFGHRMVHGGNIYSSPVIVDDTVERNLAKLQRLAPLHMPAGIGVLKRARRLVPEVPQIACFDTAFHTTQPDEATRLPLPGAYFDRGYRRYGFHGLNYEHVVSVLPRLSGTLPRRLIIAHLGQGASMCAVKDGRSVATTMGYSTADGLVMGTRTGAIDPGVLVSLLRDDRLTVDELDDLIYRGSGLLGLSGISGDMRTLLESEAPEARRAVDHYCYWAARHAGSLAVALQGLDALVFTGGIGENAPLVRSRILDHLAWLGVSCDVERNRQNAPSLSAAGVACPVFIVKANEEVAIARHVLALVRQPA
jgi:acetate kinase